MRQTIQLATRFPSSHLCQVCAIVSLHVKYSQKWSKIANNGTPLYRAPKQAANKQITQGKKIPHLSAGAPRACSQNWQSFYINHRSHNASHTESPKKAKDDGFLVTIYENSMVLANISSWAAPISCTAVRLVRNVLFLAHFFRYC